MMRHKRVFLIAAAVMALTMPIQAATSFTVAGNWTEVFGPGGEGSAGGTISATLSGGSWTVTLVNAIHQGVSGNPSPGVYDTNYVVTPANPATIVSADGCTSLKFSNLILMVQANQNTASFTATTAGTSDGGQVQLLLSGSGQVTAKSGSNPGDTQSGPMTAQVTLTFSPPHGSTFEAFRITETSAILKGDIVEDGGLCCQYRFVYWRDGDKSVTTAWEGPAKKYAVLSYLAKDLTPGSLYHFRIEVQNSVGMDQAYVRDFVTTARLMVSSSGRGSVLPREGQFLGPVGTVLTFEAKAAVPFAFMGWAGTAVEAGLVNDPAAATTTVVLKGDMTLKAIFKAKIVWVSDAHTTSDPNVRSDKGWTDLLEATGLYTVDNQGPVAGTPYWWNLDPNKLAALDDAALVIVSRDCSNGSLNNDLAERTAWSNVKSPLMLMNVYIGRANRWQWFNSNTVSDRQAYNFIQAVNPAHPLFAGVTLDPNNTVEWIDPCVASGLQSFLGAKDVLGTGTALAVKPDNGNPQIVLWEAGAKFYATSDQTPANRRMLFSAGCHEKSGETINWGNMNMNAEGQKMFLNAVEYLLVQPEDIPLVNPSFEDPNAGKIKGWNGEGVGGTPAIDIPGWASDTAPADSGVEQGWGATDGTWTAFLMSGDPPVYQLTDYQIKAGDVFNLRFDAKNNWVAKKLMAVLYYDDTGMRIPVLTQEVTLTDAMQTFAVSFGADAAPECVGMKLGIEFTNSTTGGASWLGLDNIHLCVFPAK